jgi:hypothetical protein
VNDMAPGTRAIAFVTTCSRDGWAEYGQRFAESFVKCFPPQARLYFYIDFKAPLRNERIVFRSIPNECRKLLEFQDGLGRFTFARGRVMARSSHEHAHHPHIMWNAFKFSFKVFCVQHAVATAREDAIVWIDADTFAFAEVPWSVIEETVPADCMVSYLGRAKKYTETGYIGYNLRHPLTLQFVNTVAEMYTSGALFSLKEWHDCYVWDSVRLAFEQSFGVNNFNISADCAALDHVFVNCVLGRYLDHMKGERKEAGQSKLTDLTTHADVDYWSTAQVKSGGKPASSGAAALVQSKASVYWVVAQVDPKIAAYRVRTVPLAKALGQYSIEPVIISFPQLFDSVEEIAAKASAVIVSKPGTTEHYLCVKYLRSRGVRVLADLCDNYFSWSPAVHAHAVSQHWLRCLEHCSGICASTPAIAETVRKLGVRDICLVTDPVSRGTPRTDIDGTSLSPKWSNPEQVELVWFGISDNPCYQAGLDDLISWSRAVSRIRTRLSRWRLRLTICTNRAPAVEAAMLWFRNEGINVRFVAWTQDGCDELLNAAHVALIPSNLGGFSLSKTHNRCSDSLSRECLVLASPQGPYRDIPGAVYRDVEALCDDLDQMDRTRIASQLAASYAYLSNTYVLTEQARKLADFILGAGTPHPGVHPDVQCNPPPVLIGASEVKMARTVTLAKKLGYLSAGHVENGRKVNFDFTLVSTDSAEATVTIVLSEDGKQAVENITRGRVHNSGFRIVTSGGTTRIIVELGESRSLLADSDLMSSLVSMHPDWSSRMVDLNVAIIIAALRQLGFGEFEVAASNKGGWEGYLHNADPNLVKSSRNLHQLWRKYQSNELEMGAATRA